MNGYDFGRRLRDLRHARGETLEQVSAATGLSVAMLSRVERGERLPSPESVEALAEHFGLPADDLMSDTIAARMFNRYGHASSSRAAERIQSAAEEGYVVADADFTLRSMATPFDALTDAGPPPRMSAPAPSAAPLASMPASAPASRAGFGFRARPVEDLFPAATLDALADATRVAEVALQSAMAAARRAAASDDERVAAQGRRAIERLRRAVEG